MELTVGQIVEGKITGITNFGVFVDLGDGKSGMVHISEVAQTYVSEIREHVKENDVVKMKVLAISDEGKISLSIKRAAEPPKKERNFERRTQPKPDNSFVWGTKQSEPASFEEMMNKFKVTSEEKFSDLKRKNPEARRTKRGAGIR
ncbi:MAG: S1 RNA-binding domain-containing protein [Clostridia bacterium]|nr:S1 RNA-binding domain-containing protein [Clostridia bacterium]